MGSFLSKQDRKIHKGDSTTKGLYSNVTPDYDQKVVRKLVMSKKLAPFYKGLEQIDTELTKDESPSVLYTNAIECPICFLYYPSNINYSKCCDQPLCTECFVQIKRIPTTCPFCVQPNFGVMYQPPNQYPWFRFNQQQQQRRRRQRRSLVLIDHIRLCHDSVDSSIPIRQYYATDRAMETPSFEDWMMMEAVRRSLQDQP